MGRRSGCGVFLFGDAVCEELVRSWWTGGGCLRRGGWMWVFCGSWWRVGMAFEGECYERERE